MTTRRGTISFEELPFGNALFPCQNAFKKCTTKTRLLMTKAISKSCTLDCSCKCPCTFPHSYAQ